MQADPLEITFTYVSLACILVEIVKDLVSSPCYNLLHGVPHIRVLFSVVSLFYLFRN